MWTLQSILLNCLEEDQPVGLYGGSVGCGCGQEEQVEVGGEHKRALSLLQLSVHQVGVANRKATYMYVHTGQTHPHSKHNRYR